MPANLEGIPMPPTEAELAALPKRALVIAAHPDDADFGAAGTAFLWTQQGWEFYYLVCTDGSKGSDDASITRQQLIDMRRQEQRDAAAILGVRDVFYLDHVDGELTANRTLLGDVVRVIRQVRPTAVFTHDPESVIVNDAFVNHADHRATGLMAVDAVYPAARDRLNFPEHIADGLETHKVSQIYIWGSPHANYEVDITDVIDKKIEALLAHKSQFEAEFITNILERWKNSQGRYIEPYRRVLMGF
jgi:LmbE family N-acetylglucosaminyl deacetylase